MVEWKKLGSICKFQNGFAFKSELFKDEGIPVVRITNISDNKVNMDECKYFNLEDYGDLALFKINKGDILIAMSGATTGKIGVYQKQTPAYLNQRVGRFVPQNNILDNRYLYHYLVGKGQDIYIMAGGGAQPNLSSTKLMENLVIAVPILDEQKQISGILDTFTSSIENLKEQIAQRRKQYEYYRDQLLDLEGKDGIEIKSLKEIVKSYCTGATPKKGTAEFYDGGTVPWLRTQDVRFNEIYTIDSYVTNEAVEKTGIKWIPANCVIIAISGATAGRCAINKIPTTTNQHCLNLEINPKKALYKYVYYCVYNAYDKMISKKQGVRGDLNSSIILGIKIPVPSIEQQSRIVSILDTFEASIQNLEEQLKEREKQYEYYRNKLLTFE